MFNLEISKEKDFEEIVLKKLFQNIPAPVIFDVGAFIGEKTSFYKRLFPGATITCFEPFPDSFSRLSKNLLEEKGIKLENVALSNRTGLTSFSVKNDFDQGNSLLASSNEEFGKMAAEMLKETANIQVETTTLDEYISLNKIKEIHLLKLDVQGAELMVLQGAQKAMNNKAIDFIFLEAQFLKMYEDQPYFHDISKFLYDNKFRFYNFFGGESVGFRLREVNALFYRNDLEA